MPDLEFRVKTETTILVEVAGPELETLQAAPALLFDIEHPVVDEIYLVPPVRFPDARFYLKMGCNVAGDRDLDSEPQMGDWMRGSAVEEHRDVMLEVLLSVMPDLAVERISMKPCLVTYTSHGLPYVDRAADGLFVAAGGNGSAAKCADALGGLAANLVMSGSWTDPLPAASFRAVRRSDAASQDRRSHSD